MRPRKVRSAGSRRALLLALLLAGAAQAHGAPEQVQALAPTPGGAAQSIVTLSTRPGVTQRLLLIQPGTVRTGVVIYAGGSGRVGIRPIGLENGDGMLLAGRERLAALGILVAIVDVPSDHDTLAGLTNFRIATEHALDAAAVIHLLRQRGAPSVWVAGSSRGTVSALNAAARLSGGLRPDGVVLASSLLRPAGEADWDVVFHVPLDRVRGPVLIVHHAQDACSATPFEDVSFLKEALRKASPVEVLPITGGGPVSGPPCTAQHHHGFAGQTGAVLEAIGAWMLNHAQRLPPDPAPIASPVG